METEQKEQFTEIKLIICIFCNLGEMLTHFDT